MPGERVVDRRPDLVARCFVALEVVNPETHAVVDRGAVEAPRMTSGAGAFSTHGEFASASPIADFTAFGARQVARADFDVDTRRSSPAPSSS